MARTIIVNPKTEESGDDTALWIVLLVAFAVVLFAILGFNRTQPSTTGGTAVTPPAQAATGTGR